MHAFALLRFLNACTAKRHASPCAPTLTQNYSLLFGTNQQVRFARLYAAESRRLAPTVKSIVFRARLAHSPRADKGKPIERWGRKATGLTTHVYDSGVAA